MKILVDTTESKIAKISLYDGETLVEQSIGSSPVPLISQILEKHHLQTDEVDYQLVNKPGSYTGLKVGASVVNALTFANGKTDLVFPDYE
jgi:tRNA A37 threonylcarbamoyladenosine modification protein TsaB